MPAKTKSQHTCLPNHPGPLITEEVVAAIVMVARTITIFTKHLLHACQALWQTLNRCPLI